MEAHVVAVFERVQQPHSGHKQALKQLKQLKAKHGGDFATTFLGIANHLLLIFKKERAVERLVDLCVKFVADDSEADGVLLNRFMQHLLQRSEAEDKAVRFRCVEMLSRLLNALPEEAELDEEVCDSIVTFGRKRLRDKIPGVRVQAIEMLTRLQDPGDAEDLITAEYLRMAQSDSSPDVRRAALMQMEPTKATVPTVIAVTRDRSDAVRREAYRYIRDKVDIRALPVADRIKLLREGLADRTPTVRKECVAMLCGEPKGWYASGDDRVGAALELLGLLGVVEHTDVCEAALREVLVYARDWPGAAERLGPLAEVTPEGALFFRVLAEHLRAAGAEEALEALLPAVPEFGRVLRGCVEKCAEAAAPPDVRRAEQFVAEQLLCAACGLDYADDYGRSHMSTAMRGLLRIPGLPDSVVRRAVQLSAAVHPDEVDRVRILVEGIAELKCPIERQDTAAERQADRDRKLANARITQQINQLRFDLDEAAQAKDYSAAHGAKTQIQALEAERAALAEAAQPETVAAPAGPPDPARVAASLLVAKHLLLSTALSTRLPELAGMVTTLVVPAAMDADPALRLAAIEVLCIACIAHGTPALANESMPMLLLAADKDEAPVRHVALRGLFDLLMTYGEAALESGERPLVPFLRTSLDAAEAAPRTIAAEGFAKLLLMNHCQSADVFSALALLYFSPATKEDIRLRQCLHLFFPAYACSSSAHAQLVADAFLGTVRAVLAAPKKAPLGAVKARDVAEFFVALTRQEQGAGLAPGETPVHADLAPAVLNEMLVAPSGATATALGPVLSKLRVEAFAPLAIKKLRVVAGLLASAAGSKRLRDQVAELDGRLEAADRAPGEELTPEQQAEVEATVERHAGARLTESAPATRPRRSGRARAVVTPDSGSEAEEELEGAEAAAESDAEEGAEAEEEEGEEDGEEPEVFEVETLLKRRTRRRCPEYLVKWKGYDEDSNTWEPVSNLPEEMVAAFEEAEAAAKEAKSAAKTRTRGGGRATRGAKPLAAVNDA